MTKAIVNLDLPGPLVSRHQHGHFAEHLGHCIYEGIFVGADAMSRSAGVPSYIANVMVATALLTMVTAIMLTRCRVRRR